MTPKMLAQFAIGPVATALLALIALPVTTWLFSPETIGHLAMLQVVLGCGVLAFSLGLDQAYVREFHEDSDKARLLRTAMFPSTVLTLVSATAIAWLGDVFSLWVFGLQSYILGVAAALGIVVVVTSRFYSLVLRMHERALEYSFSQAIPKVTFLFFLLLCWFFSWSKTTELLLVAHVVALSMALMWLLWAVRKEVHDTLRVSLNSAQAKSMLGFGAPLVLGGLAFWGLTAMDRVFLRIYRPAPELGVYSVAANFAAAATVLQSIFSTVWAPTVYKWAAAGVEVDKIYSVVRFILMMIVIVFCGFGMLSWLIPMVLPSEYVAVQYIVVSCIGFPLLYTLSETTVVGVNLARRSGYAMMAAVLALLVNLLGNWLLVPELGASGAAVSTCVSFWVFLILRTEASIALWRPLPRLDLYLFSGVAVALAVFVSVAEARSAIIGPICWGVLLLITLWRFQNEGRDAWNFLGYSRRNTEVGV